VYRPKVQIPRAVPIRIDYGNKGAKGGTLKLTSGKHENLKCFISDATPFFTECTKIPILFVVCMASSQLQY